MRRVVTGLLIITALLAVLALVMPSRLFAAPAQDSAVDARIQIVWPHDASGQLAPVESAPLVNVEVYLFEPGSMDPVACSFDRQVALRQASNRVTTRQPGVFPARDVAVAAEKITRTVNGRTFPVWLFNDVPTDSTGVGTAYATYFIVDVEGQGNRTNVWAHAADPRTYLPLTTHPVIASDTAPAAIDAFIQVVWPHDEAGMLRPVAEAPLVNIAAELFHFPYEQQLSVAPVHAPGVLLRRAFNDGYLNIVRPADQVVTQVSGLSAWSRWVWNDISVPDMEDGANKYYFAIDVEDVETNTTIWAHGADPRTFFPQRDIPTRSCLP